MDLRVVRGTVAISLSILFAACSGGSPTNPTNNGGSSSGGTTNLTTAGQSAAFLDSANFNTTLDLAAGGTYLIAIVNTATTATSNEAFTLAGTYSASSGSRVAPIASHPSVAAASRPGARFSLTTPGTPRYTVEWDARRVAALRRMQKNHMKMLEHDNEVLQKYAGLRARGPVRPTVRPMGGISQTVGTVNKIYVAKEFGATCSDVDSIGARTVAVGQHVVVLADTSTGTNINGQVYWNAGLRPDSSFYQTFANEYDALTFEHILKYIGNPLALDNQLSNVGKITVVISPVLNGFGGGIVAFVDGCDFNTFTPSGVDESLDNQTEMFYYWTPDTSLGWNTAAWEELMRATAAHESKHIVSFTDRIINNNFTVPELIWLEEGLAQESSEIWERNFNQATWKGHATFAQTVECESIFSGGTTCDPDGTKPIALTGSHLPFLWDYLQEESAGGGGLGTDTPSNYGAGWEFARWATDIYGSTEPDFIMSLVNEPALNGLPNLAKHTNASIPELLVYWSLATGIYDTTSYTASDVRTTIPSFNFENIFYTAQDSIECVNASNQTVPCGLFTQTGQPSFPVAPVAYSEGTINATDGSLAGTAAYYIVLTAQNAGSEHLVLENSSGGTISSQSNLRVGIIRIR
jgi:hypothetical protein